MKFVHDTFSCDVDIFQNDKDLVVRFYDKLKEQDEEEIVNLVLVDPGYGYLSLKFKGENGLLSGFLDENLFSTDAAVAAAIAFVENLSPLSPHAYIPHHVRRFKTTSFVEYNGEY